MMMMTLIEVTYLLSKGLPQSGMTGAISAGIKAHCHNFSSLPLYVVEHFAITSKNFKKNMFIVSVSFSSDEYRGTFWMAYCKMCSSSANLTKEFLSHLQTNFQLKLTYRT